MRIAFLNPWRNASENQAFRSLEITGAIVRRRHFFLRGLESLPVSGIAA